MISDPTARQAGKDIAERIRQELVCCDIYERINRGDPDDDEWKNRVGRAILEHKWHDLCYWGEASAQIAEGSCPLRTTIPDVCQCDCSGCLTDCWNHVDLCACGHSDRQHIAPDREFGPQCKVCVEDGEGTWKHKFTPEEVS